MKSLDLEPDPVNASRRSRRLLLAGRMTVGPPDGPGVESFGVTICTPEWLAQAAKGGFYDARHHVVVNFDAFDKTRSTEGSVNG